MKIGILTWSKTVNHGAVLQAYATHQMVTRLGSTPVILDYPSNRIGMDGKLRYRLKRLKSRLKPSALYVRSKLASWNEEKKSKFIQFREENLNLGEFYNIEQGLSACVIGSDMVFDFFEGYSPYMYGKDVCSPYTFSYAACFGYTTTELFSTYPKREEIVYYIKKLKAVAVRDDNSGEILKDCCGITSAVKTIDPVLLYGFSEELKEWDSNKWSQRKYVLIYSYTYNMEKTSEVKTIRNFARKHGLEVISLGYIHPWCDESVNADPKEFVEMFKYASYVFTDTFHGTVFSIVFQKQFCSVVRNNAFKVVDLLKELDISSRIAPTIQEEVSILERAPLDYNKINLKLNTLRLASKGYLQEQIEKASEIVSD